MAGTSSFKRYYEDELAFLRELGGEFSHAYPDIARELGLAGHDPDVERLLQGVAFLTGRIRQGLDAQFPDLLYPLLGHLWPQALKELGESRLMILPLNISMSPNTATARSVSTSVTKAGVDGSSGSADASAARVATGATGRSTGGKAVSFRP